MLPLRRQLNGYTEPNQGLRTIQEQKLDNLCFTRQLSAPTLNKITVCDQYVAFVPACDCTHQNR